MIFRQIIFGCEMIPKYKIGQKIIITPVAGQRLSPRGSELDKYSGQNGQIVHYYSINTDTDCFYIYTIKTDTDKREIVLHEDEIQIHLG